MFLGPVMKGDKGVIFFRIVAEPQISPVAGGSGGNIPLVSRQVGDLLLVERGGWFTWPDTVAGWIKLKTGTDDFQLWGRIATNDSNDNFLNTAPNQQTITQMASFGWPYATVSRSSQSAELGGSSANLFTRGLDADGGGIDALVIGASGYIQNSPGLSGYSITGPDGTQLTAIDTPSISEQGANQALLLPWSWWYDAPNSELFSSLWSGGNDETWSRRGVAIRLVA